MIKNTLTAATSSFNTPKGQASLSEKQTRGEKLKGITTKSSKTTRGTFRIVYVPARKGHGLIITGMRQAK